MGLKLCDLSNTQKAICSSIFFYFVRRIKVVIILLFTGCPISLPSYSNAMLVSGGNQTDYLHGHVLTYECNSHFSSKAGPLQCTCNATADPHQWICSPEDLRSTCRRSNMLHYYKKRSR